MKYVIVQQPRVSEPWAVSDKVKMAKERATHICFSATTIIKYVFYICEKIGEKYHFTISNISAECTILEDRDGTDSSFWLSNEQKVVLSQRMSLMISPSPFCCRITE